MIQNIEDNLEHEVAELICLKCFYRWIGVYPEACALKQIECRECGEIGYVIKTGQTLPEGLGEIDIDKMESDVRYQNMVKMWGRKVATARYKVFCLDTED